MITYCLTHQIRGVFSGGGARERSPKFVVAGARDFGKRSLALALLRRYSFEANSRSIVPFLCLVMIR